MDILIPLRTLCNCDQDMETNLILAVLMAKGPCLPAWLRFVFFSQVASTSQQPSYLDLPPAPELDWMETGQPLTFIGHQVQWERANAPSVPGHPSPLAFFFLPPATPPLAFLCILTIPVFAGFSLLLPCSTASCAHSSASMVST